jgi:hypothetical protein
MHMKAQWVKLGGAALILGSALVACNSDRTTGVGPATVALKRMKAPPPPAGTQPETVTVVRRRVPLPADVTKGVWIGAGGGQVEIKEAGVKLVVPKGAVASDTYFTITALKGDLIAYDFGPSGSTFYTVPLRVEQEKALLILPTTATHVPTAGYWQDHADLYNESTVGVLAETRPVTEEYDALAVDGKKLVFSVEHFSGYLIATGRNSGY